MKLISMLVFLVLVSCSGNDSTQTEPVFLDQYNGVVWQNDIWTQSNSSEQEKYIIFNKQISAISVFYNPNKICSSTGIISIGSAIANGKVTKITNQKDFFSIDVKLDGSGVITTDSYTISANGSKMTYKFVAGQETYSTQFTRTALSNPCN